MAKLKKAKPVAQPTAASTPRQGHYCTHAIEFMLETAHAMETELRIPADLEHFVAQYLDDAMKFILPDNGQLLSGQPAYDPRFFDLLKLPYPMCALEFAADEMLYNQGSGLAFSARRIALCFDPAQLPADQLARLDRLMLGRSFLGFLPEHALALMAVYEVGGMWVCAGGCVVIDLDEGTPHTISKDADGKPLLGALAESAKPYIGMNEKTIPYGLPAQYVLFLQRMLISNLAEEEATRSLYIDTIDEVRVCYDFLAAVNCDNVGTLTVAAPRMLNAKRMKKGKVPFYDYKVLDLAPKAEGGTGEGAGSHASPRTHLRRGHVRRLGEKFGNKVLWINATMVNPQRVGEKESAPVKTYRVRA